MIDKAPEHEILEQQGLSVIRMRFALLALRAFSGGVGALFDTDVINTINAWIDSGMNGPVPYPQSQEFSEWATARGWKNMSGYIVFSLSLALKNA